MLRPCGVCPCGQGLMSHGVCHPVCNPSSPLASTRLSRGLLPGALLVIAEPRVNYDAGSGPILSEDREAKVDRSPGGGQRDDRRALRTQFELTLSGHDAEATRADGGQEVVQVPGARSWYTTASPVARETMSLNCPNVQDRYRGCGIKGLKILLDIPLVRGIT
jgi:hypothetical protein